MKPFPFPEKIMNTERGDKGFGSTGISEIATEKEANKIDLKIQLQNPENGRTVGCMALLDSGANGLFIDEKWARSQGWRLYDTTSNIQVYNVDGTRNVGGPIKFEVDLMVRYKEHQERATFYVTNLGTHKVIMGLAWLKRHNPTVDWRTGAV